MPLFKMIVAYDGSRFSGIQRQTSTASMLLLKNSSSSEVNNCNDTSGRKRRKGKEDSSSRPPRNPSRDMNTGRRKKCLVTIQECLELALLGWIHDTMASDEAKTISIETINLRFAGRTDKGVHARGQVIAVRIPEQLKQQFQNWEIRRALNSRLPVDISVEEVNLCSNDAFDPRTDVIRKQYSYTIKYRRRREGEAPLICDSGINTVRSALDSPCLWVCPWSLDDSRMPELCSILKGEHNFRNFVHKSDRNERDHTMTLERMEFQQLSVESYGSVAFPVVTARVVVEAKGFRRSMVRNLVGFCVDVCRGDEGLKQVDLSNDLWKDSGDDMADKIHAAPASGLCLERVHYD